MLVNLLNQLRQKALCTMKGARCYQLFVRTLSTPPHIPIKEFIDKRQVDIVDILVCRNIYPPGPGIRLVLGF